jgi:hypothetical protein
MALRVLPGQLPRSKDDLLTWLGQAAPGDRLTYWRGHLAADVYFVGAQNWGSVAWRLVGVRRCAWDLAQQGWVQLVQQRVAPDVCAYIAIVTSKCQRQAASLQQTIVREAA